MSLTYPAGIKRFYKMAQAAPGAGAAYRVLLDERPVRTPGRTPLQVPNAALAEAVAAEWAAQGERVQPLAMPLTSLACTAVDLVVPRRSEVLAEVMAYAETDLVCYRADRPEELVRRQQEAWQPLVDWAMLALDAPLQVTSGVLPCPQDPAVAAALQRAVEAHDDFALTALAAAVKAAGSLVVGLALSHGRIDPEAAYRAAELDALFQIEQWGEDAEASRRLAGVHGDLASAARFLALLRD